MRALLLYPVFPPSYWSYEGLLEMIGRKALLPPLSLITVAAILPRHWQFRLVDCNARDITEDDWAWAEIVLLSGMIVQKEHLLALIREAKQRDKRVVVGGPYVTSVPGEAQAAGADFLVMDEGEITIPKFLQALEAGASSAIIGADGEKPDMTQSPIPRYDLLNFEDYSEMSLQFSRGCPFLCEFCDIIVLYGRRPRTKTPQQVLAELQTIYDLGWRRSMFMVDDNFIGNKRNVKPLLEAMIPWQKKHGYPFSLTTEASVNLADDAELLELMVQANFGVVFLGIETPDTESLKLTRKKQNTRKPLVQQVRKITAAGMRVMGSFIIGFDHEKPGADQRILQFVDEAAIPHVMVSMLQALPNTHLSERLAKEQRLMDLDDHANLTQSCLSNFVPTRPLRELAQEHVNCNLKLYEPTFFLDRAMRHCLALGRRPSQKWHFEWKQWREVSVLLILLWRQGVIRPSRRDFWRALITVAKKNPQKIRTFLIVCAHFEHFYQYRMQIQKDVTYQINQLSDRQLDQKALAQQKTQMQQKTTGSFA